MNRNAIKQWSITYPQCLETTRSEFTNSFPPYNEAICSREEHADGGWHLHLGIKLKHAITKSKLLKWVAKKYPNDFKRIDIQPTRSIHCWSDYITKEDPEPFIVKLKLQKKYTEADAMHDIMTEAMERAEHKKLEERAKRQINNLKYDPDFLRMLEDDVGKKKNQKDSLKLHL